MSEELDIERHASDDATSVTVILLAFRRKEYILNALKSVLHQTVSRSRYEILAVKNFIDASIDRVLLENGVKLLNSSESSLGGKISEALEYSSGRIICFLEDDDLFAEDKIEKVLKYFSQFSDIGYVHNSAQYIDRNSKEFSAWYSRYTSRDLHMRFRDDMKRSYPQVFRDKSMYHNLSSWSILRDELLHWRTCLKGRTYFIDFLVFLKAAESGRAIIFSKDKLTIYRRHSSATSIDRSKAGEYFTVIVDDASSISDCLSLVQTKTLARNELNININKLLLTTGRRTGIPQLKNMIYYVFHPPYRYIELLPLVIIFLMGAVMPSVALNIYNKFAYNFA